jgi:glucose/arabinose dehydrogenase
MLNKFPYFVQYDPSHSAKALPTKYPEVGLPSPKGPMIVDPQLRAEVVVRGLRYPTSMAFLGPNDILVTEKDAGTVRRVVNNTELQEPLLNVSVATFAHRGLLGIAVAPFPKTAISHGSRGDHNSTTAYVFLYYTQAQTNSGDDITEGK